MHLLHSFYACPSMFKHVIHVLVSPAPTGFSPFLPRTHPCILFLSHSRRSECPSSSASLPGTTTTTDTTETYITSITSTQYPGRHCIRAAAIGLGVNCCAPSVVGASLQEMRNYTNPGHTLVCYPNSDEVWDGASKTWISAPVRGSGAVFEALCACVGADGDATGIPAQVAVCV